MPENTNPQPPVVVTLQDAMDHLGAALIISQPSDCQVILDHVQSAHQLLKETIRTLSGHEEIHYGINAIRQERLRQVQVEGWTPEHDDQHNEGEMAWAAVCYAAPSEVQARIARLPACHCRSVGECNHFMPVLAWQDPWPWSPEWDKRGTHNRKRSLAIAGALIAAEIDRLERLESRPAEGKP